MLRNGFRATFVLAFAGTAVFAFATSGCLVMQRDHDALAAKEAENERLVQQVRADNAAVRAELEATRQRLDNALRANADSSTDVMSSKHRINDLSGRVDEVQHGVEELKREVAASRTELYARMDEMKRTQQPAPAPPPVAIPQDKSAHFAQLRDAHTKRDWAMVRALGPEFINRYPTDERADEVLYLMGEADLMDGRPSSALGHFNRLLKLYPRSKVLDRTLFSMGEAYMTMHDCSNAKLAYEACDKRFSKEKIGADARAKLQLITKNQPGLCAPQ